MESGAVTIFSNYSDVASRFVENLGSTMMLNRMYGAPIYSVSPTNPTPCSNNLIAPILPIKSISACLSTDGSRDVKWSIVMSEDTNTESIFEVSPRLAPQDIIVPEQRNQRRFDFKYTEPEPSPTPEDTQGEYPSPEYIAKLDLQEYSPIGGSLHRKYAVLASNIDNRSYMIQRSPAETTEERALTYCGAETPTSIPTASATPTNSDIDIPTPEPTSTEEPPTPTPEPTDSPLPTETRTPSPTQETRDDATTTPNVPETPPPTETPTGYCCYCGYQKSIIQESTDGSRIGEVPFGDSMKSCCQRDTEMVNLDAEGKCDGGIKHFEFNTVMTYEKIEGQFVPIKACHKPPTDFDCPSNNLKLSLHGHGVSYIAESCEEMIFNICTETEGLASVSCLVAGCNVARNVSDLSRAVEKAREALTKAGLTPDIEVIAPQNSMYSCEPSSGNLVTVKVVGRGTQTNYESCNQLLSNNGCNPVGQSSKCRKSPGGTCPVEIVDIQCCDEGNHDKHGYYSYSCG